MNGIVGKFISFWMFIIGVLIFGKIFGKAMGSGFMEDSKSTIIVLVAAAIVFLVWTIGRSKAAQRREEREWQEKQARLERRKAKGSKRR